MLCAIIAKSAVATVLMGDGAVCGGQETGRISWEPIQSAGVATSVGITGTGLVGNTHIGKIHRWFPNVQGAVV